MESGVLRVAGCPIAWCALGDPDADEAIVLLHGMRAHRHWWDAAVAAGLGRGGRRVVAFDLSGHGESGRRRAYSPEAWADEALALIREYAGARAALVGHSMGGLAAIVAAARGPELVSALVLVDVRIRLSGPEAARVPRGTPAKTLRTFPTREAAIESIKLFPPQPEPAPEVMRGIAEHSIGPVDGGWGWRFDPPIAQRFDDETINRNLAEVRCPIAMVYGERSDLVDSSSAAAAEAILGRPVPAKMVAGGHHHLILDRPEASAAAIVNALDAAAVSPSRRRPAGVDR